MFINTWVTQENFSRELEECMQKQDQAETLDFILANICHLHHTRAHRLFEEVGLYRGQPPVLMALWEQEGLTQTELAEQLHITPATVTRMLQRMERTGFIQRQPDPLDQRISRVYLTEAGTAVQSQVEAMWKTMETETFGGLSGDEQEILRGYLLRIRKNLQVATGEESWK